MPPWLIPLMIAIGGLIINGFVLVFTIGKFTGKYTTSLINLDQRVETMDQRNRKEQDDQWSQLGELREDVSYLKGRGGLNGQAKGHHP